MDESQLCNDTRQQYPFAALVGHDELQMALLLAAVDPKIGGVLIAGPRGSAKSTAARSLSPLLPGQAPFVNLPLGATEDRLVGSLDIQQVLGDGKVEFHPGLLYTAHGGILYVDEINLLADHLVDLLLDTAASGVNIVEREGVSHQHRADILLIGTMNPDEGELRPQLLDRFGFFVAIQSQWSTREKTDIVKRRLKFESDGAEFLQQYAQRTQALRNRIQKARQQLPEVGLDDAHFDYVCELTHEAAAEGVRADLVIVRASRAYAAWQGKSAVEFKDIDYVAPFALAHRRKQQPDTPAAGAPIPQDPKRSDETSPSHETPPKTSSDDLSTSRSNDAVDQDWGALPPQGVPIGPGRTLPYPPKKKAQ